MTGARASGGPRPGIPAGVLVLPAIKLEFLIPSLPLRVLTLIARAK
jgi:hypothetical protein